MSLLSQQKENIEKFITFCEAYGVKDRFSTPYLYQKQNVMAVSTVSINQGCLNLVKLYRKLVRIRRGNPVVCVYKNTKTCFKILFPTIMVCTQLQKLRFFTKIVNEADSRFLRIHYKTAKFVKAEKMNNTSARQESRFWQCLHNLRKSLTYRV